MNSSMNDKFNQTISKSSELICKAFDAIHQLTAQLMKFSNQQPNKNKDKDLKEPQDNNMATKPNYELLNNVLYQNKQKKIKNIANNKKQTEEKSNTYDKYLGYLDNYDPIDKQQKKDLKMDKANETNKEDTKKSIKKSSKLPIVQQTTKGKVKQAIPQKPKYPVSAFLRFNRDNIEIVKKDYPHMSSSDLVTVTGNMWNQLRPDLKKKYQEDYAKDKQRYDAALIEYHRKYPQQKKAKQKHRQQDNK